MSALTLTKGSLFPKFATDLFGNGSFLNPSMWNFDGDFFNMDMAMKVPSVNIMEHEKDFLIQMAAPGMEKKDFKISLENGMLMISAEKKEESREEKENFARREFSYNSFSRSFRIPDNCLPDKIDAKYDNGLLLLTLPKKEITITKTVKEIKVA